MSSISVPRVSARGWFLAALLLLSLISLPAGAAATDAPDGTEIWLVTYGPGEVYWQRFGHNAIWVRDERLGLDHTFNFGFFDFGQENFFMRFLMGRMLYFSAAQKAGEEFAQYVAENRGIRAQRLNIASDRKAELVRFLLNEVRPENRDYLYDYYRNNCSTRVRDALDQALDGAIRRENESLPARLNWRGHTRRLTQEDFWLYLGLETVLGPLVDRPVSRWDEMFIPGVLADALADQARWVLEERQVYESTLPSPAESPKAVWPRYLLAALVVLLLAALLSRWLPAVLLARSWLFIGGLAGSAMLFFWFGTDHAVAAFNLNLLLFNPLWLVLALSKNAARFALQTVAVFGVLAVAVALSPGQYSADAVAAFLPINLLAAYVLNRISV